MEIGIKYVLPPLWNVECLSKVWNLTVPAQDIDIDDMDRSDPDNKKSCAFI